MNRNKKIFFGVLLVVFLMLMIPVNSAIESSNTNDQSLNTSDEVEIDNVLQKPLNNDIKVPDCVEPGDILLMDVGGWDEESLSEDMEMSAKLTHMGHTVKYAPDIRSWQENPANLVQFLKQRVRWFRGCMEVALRYGKLLKGFNRKCIDAEFTLVTPYLLALGLLGYLLAFYTLLVPVEYDPVFTVMTQVLTVFTTVALLLVGVALVYDAKPRKMTNLLWLPYIYVYWSLQTFIIAYAFIQIMLKRPRKWVKTKKTGTITNHNNRR